MRNRSKIHRFHFVRALFAIAAVLMIPGIAWAANPQGGNLMFILDASGSMWGQVEGKAKIVIAKEVLIDLFEDLPQGLNVGLVAYGHRRKGDCNDVEELVPLSVLDKQNLIKGSRKNKFTFLMEKWNNSNLASGCIASVQFVPFADRKSFSPSGSAWYLVLHGSSVLPKFLQYE